MAKEIILSGDVGWEITANGIRSQLPKGSEKIILKVKSPGGIVYEAFDIFNLLKDYAGKVEVIINGLAGSAASYFIMAADKRIVRSNSVFFGHKAWNFAIGDADYMAKESEILNGIDNIIAAAYSKVTGNEKDSILVEMKNEIWLFGDDIVEAGYADEVMNEDDYDPSDQDSGESILMADARARVEAVKARVEKFMQLNKKTVAFKSNIKPGDDNTAPGNSIEPVGNDPQGKVDKKIKKEVSMSLNLVDLLKQNPEAKADVEALQVTAKAEGQTEGKAEGQKAETDRILELLNLSGVKISEGVTAAIKNNLDTGAYAKAKVNAEIIARNKADEQNLGSLDGAAQLPGDTVEGQEQNVSTTGIITTEAQAQELAKNFGKGR